MWFQLAKVWLTINTIKHLRRLRPRAERKSAGCAKLSNLRVVIRQGEKLVPLQALRADADEKQRR